MTSRFVFGAMDGTEQSLYGGGENNEAYLNSLWLLIITIQLNWCNSLKHASLAKTRAQGLGTRHYPLLSLKQMFRHIKNMNPRFPHVQKYNGFNKPKTPIKK